MEYRVFSNTEAPVSLLGFGCMRFPTKDGKIDRAESRRMLDHAIAQGVNYFDTAYFYHEGESEDFIGQALSTYPRETYYLTSKLPTTLVKSLEDAKRIYAEQRARLVVDYLDFYLFHNMDAARWRLMCETGVLDWLLDLRNRGEIRHLGFSFHGSFADFHEVLTARPWDVCQIQLNYMDTEEQAGMRGYILTEERNVPVIIMEPVKGGLLASPPPGVLDELERLAPGRSAASWALRWAGSLPNVLTVLSGMSTWEQVEDNLETFGRFQPLDEREGQAVSMAAERFRTRVMNGCTGCSYCMPCPAGVDIPVNFRNWNELGIYGNEKRFAARWKDMEPSRRADACIGCGKCEEVCPQRLPIREDLKQMRGALG